MNQKKKGEVAGANLEAHPSHSDQLVRLNRIIGQLTGIKKMVEDRRYCIDILTQTKAATQAIHKVEASILENHIQHCLKDAAMSGDDLVVKEKLDEVMKLIAKAL